jgi:hypothetical protein
MCLLKYMGYLAEDIMQNFQLVFYANEIAHMNRQSVLI